MNDTQWTFEMLAMQKEDEERFEERKAMMEIVEENIVRLLGVDLLPMEDPQTHLLRRPERGEYVPLVIALGREEFVKLVIDKQQELSVQNEAIAQMESPQVGRESGIVELSPEELEQFMNQGTESENTPEELKKLMSWGSKKNQLMLESLVLAREDVDKGDPLEKKSARTIGQARQDLVRQFQEQQRGKEDLMSVKLVSSPVQDEVPERKDKIKVVLKDV